MGCCLFLTFFFSFLSPFFSPTPLQVTMGFPTRVRAAPGAHCLCHPARSGGAPPAHVFLCPQCLGRHCAIPTECRGCGLQLVSAPHLARAVVQLYPPPTLAEVAVAEAPSEGGCGACNVPWGLAAAAVAFRCAACGLCACADCDQHLREVLQACPGCLVAAAPLG